MNFLKGFGFGCVFAIALMVLLPIFMGENVSELFSKVLSSSIKTFAFARIVLICGVVFGCIFQFVAWLGKRNKQHNEMNGLMREYLERELKKKNDEE